MDTSALIRSADFHIDADSIEVHGPHAAGEIVRWLFGDEANPVVTFTTTWARPIGQKAVEIEDNGMDEGQRHDSVTLEGLERVVAERLFLPRS